MTRRTLLERAVLAPLAFASGCASAPREGPTHGSSQPHVAVIGAGAFGGWTARALQRLGARVTLIDAWGAGHARASSGGESRVVRSLYGPDRVYVDLVKRSLPLWRELGPGLYTRTGALWLFEGDDAYARRSAPHARAAGFEVEPLPLAEVANRWPALRLDGVTHAWYEPEAGFVLARRACATLAAQVAESGARVLELLARPGAIASERMRGLALSDGSTLEADLYVFACGPWLAQLFPEVIGPRIQPTRQEIHYFGVPAGRPDLEHPQLPVWVDFGDRIFYGVPGAEDRGFKVADDTRGEPFDPTHGDRTPRAEAVARSRAFLARRFPALAEAPLVEARVCQYENSPDGHLIFDRHPEARNVWLLGGGSGHGFKLAPALGAHVARAVLGTAAPEPRFSLARLARIGPRRTQMEQP